MIETYKTKISKTSQKRRDKESCIARSYRKVILSIFFLACNIFHRYLCASADPHYGKNIMNLPSNIKKLVQEFQSPDFELLNRIFDNFCAEYGILGDPYLLIKKELINQIYSSAGYFELYSKLNDAKNKFKEEIKNNLEIDKLIKAIEAIDKDKSIILSNPYILKEIEFLEFIIGGLAMINSDNPKILELKEIALNEKNGIVKKTKISKAILNLNSDPDFDSNLLELRGFLNSNSLSSDKYGPLYIIIKEILFTINDGLSYYSNNDAFKKYNIVTLYQAFIDEFNVLNSISTSHGIDKYRSVYENDPDLKPIMDDAIKFAVINDLMLYRKTIKYPKKELHDLILGKIIKFINNREFDHDSSGRLNRNLIFSELKNNIQSKIGNDKFSYYLNVHFF